VSVVGLEFEWDDDKAALNLGKHGVSFSQAALAFRDSFAIEWLDDRRDYDETRFIHLGLSEGHLLTIVFTERADRIRIISARRATKDE
jgi:uncharacterized DUF497 family protein